MSRNIPQVRVWRVTVFWNKPSERATPVSAHEGTTISEKRHYYVNAPNKRFAWWNVFDEIIFDVGAERFFARDRVTIGLTKEQRSSQRMMRK